MFHLADVTFFVSQPYSPKSGSHPSSHVLSWALVALVVPKSVDEALKDQRWLWTMQEKIQALKKNRTRTLGPLPIDKRPLDCRWVYSTKFQPHGAVDRFKAKLVAKSYNQTEGVDFHETFSLLLNSNSHLLGCPL